LAYAALAKAHSRAAFQGLGQPEQHGERAKEAIQIALGLNEVHPAVLAANGWYHYWALEDRVTALDWFERAVEVLPSDSDLLLGLGLTERRLGSWDDALRHLRLSYDLDPLSNEKAIEVGISYEFQRSFDEAIAWFEAAASLAPDQYRTYAVLAGALMARDGDLGGALETLHTGGTALGRSEFVRRMLSGQTPGLARLLILDAFPTELAQLNHLSMTRGQNIYRLDLLAERERRKGNREGERAYVDSLLLLAQDGQLPGLALARLGRRQEALVLLATPTELISTDARGYEGTVLTEGFGLLLLGDEDGALERIDHALSVPGQVSIKAI
jgi:hypothetical protein